MITIEEAKKRGREYFHEGYNCSQSVLLTLARDVYDIDSSDLIPMIATGFGGGISRQGRECGAVTGAVMAFGLKYGMKKSDDPREPTYSLVQKFYEMFIQKYHSVICKELCGYDLSTEKGREGFKKNNVHEKICSELVASAIEIFMVLVKE